MIAVTPAEDKLFSKMSIVCILYTLWIAGIDRYCRYVILLLSSMESIRALKVRESLGLSFFSKNAILFAVEFEGPPHGEDSVLDTRIEGFDTPWLHAKDRL